MANGPTDRPPDCLTNRRACVPTAGSTDRLTGLGARIYSGENPNKNTPKTTKQIPKTNPQPPDSRAPCRDREPASPRARARPRCHASPARSGDYRRSTSQSQTEPERRGSRRPKPSPKERLAGSRDVHLPISLHRWPRCLSSLGPCGPRVHPTAGP